MMHDEPSIADIKNVSEEKVEEGNVSFEQQTQVSHERIFVFYWLCYNDYPTNACVIIQMGIYGINFKEAKLPL